MGTEGRRGRRQGQGCLGGRPRGLRELGVRRLRVREGHGRGPSLACCLGTVSVCGWLFDSHRPRGWGSRGRSPPTPQPPHSVGEETQAQRGSCGPKVTQKVTGEAEAASQVLRSLQVLPAGAPTPHLAGAWRPWAGPSGPPSFRVLSLTVGPTVLVPRSPRRFSCSWLPCPRPRS